jgi:hypothetical protein
VGDEQLPCVEWLIHYDDGSTFSSLDGEPHEAPRDGVQTVTVADEMAGRLVWFGFDFYCWQDEWVPRSLTGLMHYLRQPGREKIVLQATAMGYRRFREIYDAACSDPRLAFKRGRDPREPEEPV